MTLDVDAVDMDLVGFHKAIASASVSVYVVAAVADVGVAVVAVAVTHHYGAYLGSGGREGFDRVVGASLHSRRRQQQPGLGPFYHDQMAFAFLVEQQRSVYLVQSARRLQVVDIVADSVVAAVVIVAVAVAAVAVGAAARLENERSKRLERMQPWRQMRRQ